MRARAAEVTLATVLAVDPPPLEDPRDRVTPAGAGSRPAGAPLAPGIEGSAGAFTAGFGRGPALSPAGAPV